jgi:hypothetical protein
MANRAITAVALYADDLTEILRRAGPRHEPRPRSKIVNSFDYPKILL